MTNLPAGGGKQQLPWPIERDRHRPPAYFSTLEEFLFGTSPILNDGGLVQCEATFLMRWLQRTTGASYEFMENVDFSADWEASEVPVTDGEPSGVAPDRKQALAPFVENGGRFFQIEAEEVAE